MDGDVWLPAGAVRTVLDRLAVHRPDVLVVGHDEVAEGGTPVWRDGFEPVRGVAAPIRLIDLLDLPGEVPIPRVPAFNGAATTGRNGGS